MTQRIGSHIGCSCGQEAITWAEVGAYDLPWPPGWYLLDLDTHICPACVEVRKEALAARTAWRARKNAFYKARRQVVDKAFEADIEAWLAANPEPEVP